MVRIGNRGRERLSIFCFVNFKGARVEILVFLSVSGMTKLVDGSQITQNQQHFGIYDIGPEFGETGTHSHTDSHSAVRTDPTVSCLFSRSNALSIFSYILPL